MMIELENMDMIGFENEAQARAMAPEIMAMALEAGYDPSKKPFMLNDEDDEEEKKPEA